MINTVIHLPQTDVTGLSESWLFKHCGEMHWDRLCEAIGVDGVNSEKMRDESGKRLYPTFVAIRGRYAQPLCAVQMDQHFHTLVKLNHFGRAFFRSEVKFQNRKARFDLEMLTTFVARNKHGLNQLHQSLPTNDLKYHSEALLETPQLLKLSQALRHGKIVQHELLGYCFSVTKPASSGSDLSEIYEPSPYTDYNGAGLLYFAAYPAIADTLERKLIARRRLVDTDRDWVWQASTIARDVFYYRNLDLGETLRATLKCFERSSEDFLLYTQLARASDLASIADVFTVKRFLP